VSTASSSESLALIAGSTQLPCVVAAEAQAQGRTVIAIAIEGITEPAIGDVVDQVHWLEWGDVSGFLGLLGKFRSEGITQAVMAGKVEQTRIYDVDAPEGLKSILASVPIRHTDSLINAVVKLLSGAGIELLKSTDFLQHHIVNEGTLTRRVPDDREKEDIAHGWTVAKQLGALDIGQSVVVKDRAVVAVEAMEGTDECLLRARVLAGDGAVLVKVGKPGQDLRFDVPVVGASTISAMVTSGVSALCIEANLAVLLDAQQFCQEADSAGIAVVARKQDEVCE
tara:strand:- start:1979 stop:2824 length:846 start_codon:yes stop_codon:yes gene_type:complete